MSDKPVTGNFRAALDVLIRNLVEGKPHKDILAEWDHMRGTDWFIGTRLGQEHHPRMEVLE